MAIFEDEHLHKKAIEEADKIFKGKNSAYRSMYIVKIYQRMGGKFSPRNNKNNNENSLKRWIKEKWVNIAKKGDYPVLRPTKKVSWKTPLTVDEIPKSNLNKQIKLKQTLKHKTLPKFEKKNIL